MTSEIEPIFNRALKHAFSRKKILFILPGLLLCGLFVVLFHALAGFAHPWIGNSLTFLPIFLCAGILMALGIPVIRIYHDEVKHRRVSYTRTVKNSWRLMVSIASFSIPLVVSYLILWIMLGIFYLFKGVPHVGYALGLIFSFGPFLLIFGSLVLSVVALLLLFFITPQVALKSAMRWDLAEDLFSRMWKNLFSHLLFLMLGLVPVILVVGFSTLAAALTGMTYFVTERTWAIALQWLFIMIPFAVLISPAVLFFYNFAAECFVWMRRHHL